MTAKPASHVAATNGAGQSSAEIEPTLLPYPEGYKGKIIRLCSASEIGASLYEGKLGWVEAAPSTKTDPKRAERFKSVGLSAKKPEPRPTYQFE